MSFGDLSIAGPMVALALVLLPCPGQLLGDVTDDSFDDNDKNTRYWGNESRDGNGRLVEQDGELQFVVEKATAEDYAEWPWILAHPPASKNWSIQAKVTNKPKHSTKEQVSSLALWVRPGSGDDELWLEFYSSTIDRSGFPSPLLLRQGVATSLSDLEESSLDSGELILTECAIRITYIASKGILQGWYNVGDVNEEAEWIELAHHNVTGRGTGKHANTDWQLGAQSEFDVGIYGYAENMVIMPGEIAFSSFAIDNDYVPVVVEGFMAVNDRAVVRGAADGIQINEGIGVLANDIPGPGQSRDDLFVSGVGTAEGDALQVEITTVNGAQVSDDGLGIVYTPPEGFQGDDFFFYTLENTLGESDTARVNVTVAGPMLYEATYTNPIDALRTTLAFLLRQRSGSSRLIDLYFKHRIEILLMFLNDPGLNGGSVGLPAQAGGEPPVQAQEASGGEELSAVLTSFQPGLAALMTGNGSNVEVTQAMVDQVKVFRDRLAMKASPELKNDMQTESARYNDLQDFVGKNFNEFAMMLDIDPQQVHAEPTRVERVSNSLAVVVPKFTRLAYSLWRSFPLKLDSWTRVDNAIQTSARGTIILTDPEASAQSGFYRVEAMPADENEDDALR